MTTAEIVLIVVPTVIVPLLSWLTVAAINYLREKTDSVVAQSMLGELEHAIMNAIDAAWSGLSSSIKASGKLDREAAAAVKSAVIARTMDSMRDRTKNRLLKEYGAAKIEKMIRDKVTSEIAHD